MAQNGPISEGLHMKPQTPAKPATPQSPAPPDVAGAAALSICESLLLALNDRNILPEREIMGILSDAAAGHTGASDRKADAAFHTAVADLINRIIHSGNAVRRP